MEAANSSEPLLTTSMTMGFATLKITDLFLYGPSPVQERKDDKNSGEK
jgi:hypothetical protein